LLGSGALNRLLLGVLLYRLILRRELEVGLCARVLLAAPAALSQHLTIELGVGHGLLIVTAAY